MSCTEGFPAHEASTREIASLGISDDSGYKHRCRPPSGALAFDGNYVPVREYTALSGTRHATRADEQQRWRAGLR
jgi:hypothetical protein